MSVDNRDRLRALAGIEDPTGAVVSVYLDTRWTDEHQRDRARLFVANEARRARSGVAPGLSKDLAWIEAEVAGLVSEGGTEGAQGVALFACDALGLRELVRSRLPFVDSFAIGDRPHLAPLVEATEGALPALIVFVDGVSARLIPLGAEGAGDEVTLEHAVEGRHRQGGWALLAQSRYKRHIEAHRDRHYEAVADAVTTLVDAGGVARLELAGEARAVALFRGHVPSRLQSRIAGTMPGAAYETSSQLVERAATLLARDDRRAESEALATVLTEAAKGGRAVAGVQPTLEAAARGAVHRLYVLHGVQAPDGVVERVLAAGGAVEVVDADAGLARVGGIAARLRWAPPERP
jgi:hypothetical protein